MEQIVNKEIKEKKDLHIARKIWHSVPGIVISILAYFEILSLNYLTVLLGLAFLASASVEILRLNHRLFNRWTIRLSRHIIRRSELKQISGVPYYLGSAFLVFMIFNKHIAILSLLYLAIGDPIASAFGISFGQKGYKFKNGKSIVGTVACGAFCMVLSMFYGLLVGWDLKQIYIMSFFGALAASLSETFALEDINDNLFIPLVSAVVLAIVYSNLANL
jgi:dolichol kinase